jgi:hypothetical protein
VPNVEEAFFMEYMIIYLLGYIRKNAVEIAWDVGKLIQIKTGRIFTTLPD